MKEEPVDILDKQGNKTGQTILKSKAHAKSLWHLVAHLWIYNSKGEILMQKRSPEKKVWPNLWGIAVGGHVTAGDSTEDTAVKETQEELGLKVKPQEIKLMGVFKSESKMPDGWINRLYAWSYMAKIDIDVSELTLEKEEVSEAKWFKADKLEELLNSPEGINNFSPDIIDESKTAITKIRKEVKAKP